MSETMYIVIKWICRLMFIFMVIKFDFEDGIIEKLALILLGFFVFIDTFLVKEAEK